MRKGEYRVLSKKAHGKSKTERVNDQLLRAEKRVAEAEKRLADWIKASTSDMVALRAMLSAARDAMEEHDLTISAIRYVGSREIKGFDEAVDARRTELIEMQSKAKKQAQELANEWNAQIEVMRKDGLPEEEIRAIIGQARRTMTAPEIIRMQHAQGAVSEVPEGAFEFGLGS